MDNNIGKRLDGRYELLELIGVGGMADIYKARDMVEDKIVAAKILKNELAESEDFLRRFRNESKAIALLSHPNIVKIFDVGFSEKVQFIVMEYIDGITLTEYIERQGVLKWRDALHFVTQILRALQHAHDRGIVHRDIKSQNVMLLSDGTIKVMDFGIARFNRETDKTISEKAIGSVHYISPEQAKGETTDEKSDIYSIGVMLFEMLTGRKPFDGDNPVSIALMHMQAQPKKPTEINSSIPDGLEEITLKAMQKEPVKRYSTAGEMITDIEEFKKNPSIVFEYKYFSADDQKTKYFDKPVSPSLTGETPAVAPAGKGKTDTSPVKGVTVTRRGEYDDYEDDYDDYYDEVIERRSPLLAILFATASVIVIMAAWLIFTIVTNTINDFEEGGGVEMKMPKLQGENIEAVIAQWGTTLNLNVNQEHSTEYEKGIVMRQSQPAGRDIRTGQKIEIWYSIGPQLVEIGNYELNHVDDAKSKLSRLGFPNANIVLRFEENATIPSGYVIRTEPGANSMLTLDERVTLIVSYGGGNENTQAPDVVGLTRTQAEEKARMHDVIIIFIEEHSETIDFDKIISQDPLPFIPMDKFGELNVVISAGPYPARTYEIDHTITRADITGDYIFEYYIDGEFQEHLTRRQDVGLNKKIYWEIEGTGIQTYAIYITSVATGNRGLFCLYEINFTGATPTARDIEFNGSIFSDLDRAPVLPPEPVLCPDCNEPEDECICDEEAPEEYVSRHD